LGCTVHHVPWGANVFGYVHALRGLLAREQYDVVHAHRGLLAGGALLAARQARVPVRIAYHHTADDDVLRGLLRTAYYALVKHWARTSATHIWGCSAAALTGQYGPAWAHRDQRMSVVYGGMELRPVAPGARERVRQELGIGPHAPVVGFIGRFTRAKNLFTLVEVCGRILTERADVHAVLVGDGALMGEVREAVQRTGVAERFHLPGFRADVAELLQAFDIFFQPSYWEGMPMTILEAMQAGVVVVASDAPGILEALPPERHCLCAPAEAVEAHCRHIGQALTQQGRAVAPRAFLAQFSSEAFHARILDQYNQALGRTQVSADPAGPDGVKR
jgi:glycosyltransferase EpsF